MGEPNLNPPDEITFNDLDAFYEDYLDDEDKEMVNAIKDEEKRYDKIYELLLKYWKDREDEARGL